jgi:hypothetical protein
VESETPKPELSVAPTALSTGEAQAEAPALTEPELVAKEAF